MSRKTWVIIVLGIIVFLTIVYDIFFSNKVNRKSPKKKLIKLHKQLNLDLPDNIDQFVNSAPSSPVSFGYKLEWLAIKNVEGEELVKHLNKKNRKFFRTNWSSGVEGSYEGYCFISPAVNSWTLVLNPNLGNLSDKDTRNILRLLSKEFGEAQFFGSHRIVSYAAWARFVNGELIRGFSIADGHIDMDAGDLTTLEENYIEQEKKSMSIEDINQYEVEGFHSILYGEDKVMEIAGLWSINPQNLPNYKSNSLGWIFEDF